VRAINSTVLPSAHQGFTFILHVPRNL
jgi:hypothetical protein